MTTDEQLEKLQAELAEWKNTLSEMRRRLADPFEVPDSEVAFHQETLIKMQHSAWDVEREINRIEWERDQYGDNSPRDLQTDAGEGELEPTS